MRIVVTGGGTGGHLAIAESIAKELVNAGVKPIFIGSVFGQDQKWFKDSPIFEKCYFLGSSGVMGKSIFTKIGSLLKIFFLVLKVLFIFKKEKIDKVFCVGGYSAAPAAIAAVLGKKSLYIHEQNAVYGTLNKYLKPYAKAFFSSYDESSPVADYPLREVFFKSARVREGVKYILFLGGSQGATFLNEFALRSAKELSAMGIEIIHQSGEKDYLRVRNFYLKNDIKAEVFAFDKDLHLRFAKADFAVSRAGAGSVWELAANYLPSLFVPYPYATFDHQYFNAKKIENIGGAIVKRENELAPDDLFGAIEDVKSKSLALKGAIKEGGAKKIVDFMLNNG